MKHRIEDEGKLKRQMAASEPQISMSQEKTRRPLYKIGSSKRETCPLWKSLLEDLERELSMNQE
jgi:hypothetical protein